MKDLSVFNTCVAAIEKSGIGALNLLKEMQAVLREFGCQEKPKKAKPVATKDALPPHYRTLKKKD